MKKLNDQQKIFCETYVSNGAVASDAARAAGYAEKSVRTTGWKLSREHEGCRAYIAELIKDNTIAHGPAALKVLYELLESDNDSVKLKAAMDLADRSGLKAVEKKEIILTDERTDSELQASIDAAMEELGLNNEVH